MEMGQVLGYYHKVKNMDGPGIQSHIELEKQSQDELVNHSQSELL